MKFRGLCWEEKSIFKCFAGILEASRGALEASEGVLEASSGILGPSWWFLKVS